MMEEKYTLRLPQAKRHNFMKHVGVMSRVRREKFDYLLSARFCRFDLFVSV
jgi:hypothetical protein